MSLICFQLKSEQPNFCDSQLLTMAKPLSLEALVGATCEENEITEKLACQAIDIRFMAESLYVLLSVHEDASSTNYDCPLYDN